MTGTPALVARIDALLPQTQCGQCGYDACRPYAEALAAGDADIDQCPPGGDAGARMLARLLDHPPKPVNPVHGPPRRLAELAVIDEAACIGCTKCILACPVDAILGAAQQMHTVIASLCTGCALCLPPCPVDCIEMRPAADLPIWDDPPSAAAVATADAARQRHLARDARLERLAREKAEARAQRKAGIAARDAAAMRNARGTTADAMADGVTSNAAQSGTRGTAQGTSTNATQAAASNATTGGVTTDAAQDDDPVARAMALARARRAARNAGPPS